jgi:broad specificity phosphatase PhoE
MSTTGSGIYLARHGQTAYNAEPRFQGRLPVPLDATGRAQAAELAERAAGYGFAVLYASPLERALETARIVGGRIGLEPRLDERLVETDTGDWTDRTMAEVQAERPAEFQRWLDGDPSFQFPGGESFAQQAARVRAAVADLCATPERPVLAISHRHTMRFALGGDWRPFDNAEIVPLP